MAVRGNGTIGPTELAGQSTARTEVAEEVVADNHDTTGTIWFLGRNERDGSIHGRLAERQTASLRTKHWGWDSASVAC